jgi:hypothetical protein
MLRKLGLKQNWIYEVLMETGELHRAPMGVWTEDFQTFVVDVYNDSSTYSNLKSTGLGTIYFVEDARYFVETKEADYFAKVDFRVIETLPGNPSRFVCKVLEVDTLREGEPLNRAQGMFLEYLVDRSRRNINKHAKKRYKYYKRTIRKVAPGSVYDKLTHKKWKR